MYKNIYNLDVPENSFDGFWCSATLLHIPKQNVNIVLKNIRKAIKPDGIGFISLKELRSIHESEVEKAGRFFEYYKEGEFDNIFKNAWFKIIDSNSFLHVRKNGDKVYWLTFFVKKI